MVQKLVTCVNTVRRRQRHCLLLMRSQMQLKLCCAVRMAVLTCYGEVSLSACQARVLLRAKEPRTSRVSLKRYWLVRAYTGRNRAA